MSTESAKIKKLDFFKTSQISEHFIPVSRSVNYTILACPKISSMENFLELYAFLSFVVTVIQCRSFDESRFYLNQNKINE